MNAIYDTYQKLKHGLKPKKLVSIALLLVLLLSCFAVSYAASDEIGAMARERAAQADKAAKVIESEQILKADGMVKKLAGGLVLLLGILFILGARFIKFDPFKRLSANNWHGILFLVFGVAFFAFFGYEVTHHTSKVNLFSNASSEHGQKIDSIFQLTIFITGFVFVVVQIVLFYFAYAYRGMPGRKAIYYHDNSKLETIWTIIPSIAIGVLVLYGVTIWQGIHHPNIDESKILNIEVVGEQFQWRLRYPGNDNKLGKHAFKLISSDNPIGLDSTDKHLADDKIPAVKEIHIPLGQPVRLNVRSKDVLHGVYLPQFRVNVYATPGMPTQFIFTPTKTTAQMRKEIGNPNFNYEMACSQLCGISHFNMRVVVVIEDEASYKKWLAEQPNVVADPNAKNLANK